MDPSKPKKKENRRSQKSSYIKWPLLVLVISFTLSLSFGILSEISLSNANVIVAVVVITVFLFIGILSDMLGVAITAADIKPFRAMASKKVRGAKEAISLKKNADRVASIFADIVGDVCGILSGAAGATIATALITESMSSFAGIVVASLVSAVIAGLIIFGKALMKKYSMNNAEKIVLLFAKFLSFFHFSNDKKSKKINKKKENKNIIVKKEKIEENNLEFTENAQENAEIIEKTQKNQS